MHGTLEDLRNAILSLVRTPLFTVVALCSLALGIGANSAIFSLLDQVLLRSLPIKNPEELIQIYQRGSHYGNNRGSRMNSYPLYTDYRDHSTVLNGVLCRREMEMSVSYEGSTERVGGEIVSGNYFEVLGVGAAAGRVLSQSDDLQPGGHPVVVLGYDYWQNRFAGRPDMIGQTIKVNNFPLTVIGVSAKGFSGLDPAGSPAVRVPAMMYHQMFPSVNNKSELQNRRSRWVQIFARLKPGYTEEMAKSALQIQFRNIREMEVQEPDFKDASAYTKEQFLKGLVVVTRAANGYSDLRQTFSEPLKILMGIVGLVLLIACSNVANLMIARALARRREFAIRVALGASRWRLMRPLLLESLTLSCAGGVAGLALAYLLNRLLLGFLPTGDSPFQISAAPDLRVLAFAFGVAIVTGLLFGLLPALASARTDASPALKEEGRGMSSGGSSVVRRGLVAFQVSLSILLLIAAGLFVRTLQNLRNVDTGLKVSHLIQFEVDASLIGYNAERITLLEKDVVARVKALPGVSMVGLARVPKLRGWEWDSSMTVEGYQARQDEHIGPYMDAVSPGYVETMGMKILEGRDFRDTDLGPDDKDTRVALINKKFADKYFKGKSPIGFHIGFGGNPGTKTPIEIVGVFSDSRYENLRDEIPIQALMPIYGGKFPGSFVVYVRTSGDEKAVFGQVRGLIRQIDPALPIYGVKSMEEQVDQILSTERMVSFLAAAFGAIATILAAIGLYGVLSLAVSRRLKEIGIRLALGANTRNILQLILAEIVWLMAAGIVVGVPGAVLLSRYVESQLYGLKATDPITISVAVGFIISVALLAALAPSWRARGVNPVDVLRYE